MTRSPEWNFAARVVERARGRSLLVDAPTGRVVAPQELMRGITGFAAAFLAAGLQAGDRVLIVCDLTATSSLAYLGAMYAGLVPVPVHGRGWTSSAEAILAQAEAQLVWSPPGIECAWADRRGVKRLSGLPGAQRGAPPAARAEDDLAVLMPTSGSTGLPRLVQVTHGNLIANTEAIVRSQRLAHDERALLVLPVSYCFGASVLHTHLYQGGAVVFDSRFMFPDKVLHAIGEFGCTTFAGVPTAYNILLRRSNIRSIPLKPLRRFLQAGGALAPERVHEMHSIVPHAEFFVMYGQTEATARITCLPPERLADKCGSVGLPLDNVQIRVVDADGGGAAVGQPGTIWAAGKSICQGYLDDPEASAQKFRDGWLVTGDVGYRDQDGFLWIVGRTNEFIKMRGVRVSLAEVEMRVAAAPGVHECAAAAVPHTEAGEALALYVVPEPGARDVLTSVRRSMPAEWVCEAVRLVEGLPKTPHGKLARTLLPRAPGERLPRGRASPRPPEAGAPQIRRDSTRMFPAVLARQLAELLRGPIFARDPAERQARLLAVLQAELSYAIERHAPLRRYVQAWPVDYRTAQRIADLPYLPAGVFKADPPLTLVAPEQIVRTLASSATTGQSPSRVVLDAETSRRMIRAVACVVRDFIGPARRPYLVIDTPQTLLAGADLGARAAAIQSLTTFATDIVCCLEYDETGRLMIDESRLFAFAERVGERDALAYGFTYIIWQHLVAPLGGLGLKLRMPNLRLLHSGGWKRLQDQAVSRDAFAAGAASLFGCPPAQVVDFYGMVENVGVIYPDCAHGNKHVPAFADVIIRDPLTLEPVGIGQQGLVQVCSALATSFPGFAVLTDDIAELVHYDGCPCGRRGSCFRIVKRVPQAEIRGCGNTDTLRRCAPAAASRPCPA